MIKRTLTGTWHNAKGIDQEHAVSCFDFLLNTSERRNRWYTWREFAAMMREYSAHPKTLYLASVLELRAD